MTRRAELLIGAVWALLGLAVAVLDVHSTAMGVLLVAALVVVVALLVRELGFHRDVSRPRLILLVASLAGAAALYALLFAPGQTHTVRRAGTVPTVKAPAPPPPRPAPGFKAYLSRSGAWRAEYPEGWRVDADERRHLDNWRTIFRSGSTNLVITVDWTPGDPKSPLAKAREVAGGLRGPEYRLEHIVPVRLGSHRGAEWSYENLDGRVVDYFVQTGGNMFAVEGRGEDFFDARTYARAVARSIRVGGNG